MERYRICGLLFFILGMIGCAAMFKTGHQLFLESMDSYVSLKETVRELEESSGWGVANSAYLTDIEKLDTGDFKYHYKKPNIFKRYCYYHLVVDKDTKIVKGWGFDFTDHVDPKRECGRSG